MIELFIAISLHLGLGEGWNNTHPGVRYVEGPYSIGAYINSERGVSPYASYTVENEDLFMEMGLVGGYSGVKILPMLRAGVKVENIKFFVSPGLSVDHNGDLLVGAILGVETTF